MSRGDQGDTSGKRQSTLSEDQTLAYLPELERFEVFEQLGRGGMGVVYRARDLETGEVIALKLLRPELLCNEELLHRFKNELLLARRVTHRHVCRIHELGRSGSVVYITMELVEGESLRARLQRQGALPADEAVALLRQACAGCAEAHRQRITHRDLKPENLMVTPAGEVKVLDFGLARSHDSRLTQSRAVLGTPASMAPEQVQGGPVSPATDVYALGLVLYEALTGTAAFSGETPFELGLKHLREPPRPPGTLVTHLSAELEGIVLRCLQKDPTRRFADAAELDAVLGDWQRRQAALARARPPIRHGRSVVRVVALLVLLAAIAAMLWVGAPRQSPDPPTQAREELFLPNGLHVVLAPDPEDVSVTVAVAYDSGSHVDPEGRSGIPHFLEHMLFQSTENLARGEIFALLRRVGGATDGTFLGDAVVTWAQVPREQLELALFVKAEQMGSLRFDPEVVERERLVMLRERSLGDSTLYGPLVDAVHETLFSELPHARSRLGSREDLEAITLEELVAYARTYHRPGRAVLAVSGGFATAEVRDLVDRYFAGIADDGPVAEPLVQRLAVSTLISRRETMLPFLQAPVLVLGWHLPLRFSREWYAAVAVCELLAQERGSRLHASLVTRHELASSVQCFREGLGFPDLAATSIWVFVRPDKEVELVETLIGEEIQRLLADGVSEIEVQRLRVRKELEQARFASWPTWAEIRLLQPLLARRYAPGALEEGEGWGGLTPAAVLEGARRWLQPEDRITLVALPAPKPSFRAPAELPLADLPPEPPLGRAPLAPQEIRLAAPRTESFDLANGLAVVVVEDPRHPLVEVALRIESAGPLYEPSSQMGLAALTAEALPLGTALRSGEELVAAAEELGARLEVRAGTREGAVEIWMQGLPGGFSEWMELLSEAVLRPSFASDHVAAAKGSLAARWSQEASLLPTQTELVLAHALYPGFPAGRWPSPEVLASIGPADPESWYRQRFRPDRASLVVRGSVASSQVQHVVTSAFGAWEGRSEGVALPVPGPPLERALHLFPGDGRARVLVGARTVERSHPDFPALAVTARLLQHRLFDHLRERSGLSYSIRCELDARPYPSTFSVAADLSDQHIEAVLDAILAELERLRRESASPDEIAEARSAAAGSFVVSFRARLPRLLLDQRTYNFSPDYWSRYPRLLQAVSVADVQRVASRYFEPERLQLVVAGPPELDTVLESFGPVTLISSLEELRGDGPSNR